MRSLYWFGPLAAALLTAAPVWADPLPGEGSRGVRILEAEEPPPPPPPPPEEAAPPPPAPPPVRPLRGPVIKACDRPFAETDLRLDSAPGFEKALAAKLRGGQRVVVDLASPYGDKSPAPAPLAKWLGEITASGGQVEVKQYCEGTRSLLGKWLAELFSPKPNYAYRAARKYNAVLHADAVDHVITQVEFTPRGAAQ